MKAIRVIGVLGILLGLLVVSAAAQTVQSDFDRTFRFSNLKTFSFKTTNDTLNDRRIRTGLETQLRANGFRTETGTPDFVIAYYVTSKNKLNVQDYSYGPPRLWGNRDIRVNQYAEGTLMVDFIDVKTNQVVWRGRATGALELKDVDKKITKSTEKLVKQFMKDTYTKGT
jgi:hypothetical protein